MRRWSTLTLAGSIALGTFAAWTGEASAKPLVVDRIVAIVDTAPILLSELVDRGRPFEKQLEAVPAEKREAAHVQMQRELLARLVDDRLIATEARREKFSADDAEIVRALENLARQQNKTVEALSAEVAAQGLDLAHYKAEIGRQLLEGKVLQLAMRRDSKKATSVEDIERARNALVESLRAQTYIELRL